MTGTTPPKYGLRLAAARVQDFRSLHDLTVTLTPSTTVLVGENNSGKTSFLEALAVAFGQRRPRMEDLYDGPLGKATGFEIDLRIETDDGSDFPDVVRDVIGDGIQLEEPEFFTLRVKGAVNAEGWDININRSFVKGWGTNRDAALEPMHSPPVSRAALNLLQYDMLDARRDIVEQLRNRRTYWGRTTSNLSIAEAVRRQLEKSLKKLGQQVTAGSAVLSHVKADLSVLSEALSAGKLGVELEALPRNVDDLIRAMDIVITAPSSAPFSVATQGMGTRSLAALLVFRSYVNVVRPRANAARLLSVAAFEEPEAHLHPQAQRAMFKILSQIGGQRIISTHSAHVAAIADVDAYRIFRRDGSVSLVSEVDAATAKSWDLENVRRFVQRQNPEVLFARAVGVLEGHTEAAAFPVLAHDRWPSGADSAGVSLVIADGAKSFKHIVPFLEALGIPWVIFCDGDQAADDGLKAAGDVIGRPLTRASKEVVQLPSGQTFEDYVVAQGFGPQIKAAAEHHDDGPLDDFKQSRQGKPRKKGRGIRDYTAAGGEDQLYKDFLNHDKVTVGRLLAEEIVAAKAAGTVASCPALVDEFFARLDQLRGS